MGQGTEHYIVAGCASSALAIKIMNIVHLGAGIWGSDEHIVVHYNGAGTREIILQPVNEGFGSFGQHISGDSPPIAVIVAHNGPSLRGGDHLPQHIAANRDVPRGVELDASMLVAAMPLFAIIIEALFFRQRISCKMAVCILISIVGVYLVVTVDGRLDFSSSRFYGNLLMMGSMICWVVYTFLNKNLVGKYSGMTVITYQSLASIFLFMPFVLPEIKRWPEFGSISPFILANLVFLGVVCSALEYLFYIYAVKRLGATVSTTFLNLIPVVTVVSGTLLLQEKLLWIEVLGMGLIMASIYALNKVTISLKTASDAEKKLQPSPAKCL